MFLLYCQFETFTIVELGFFFSLCLCPIVTYILCKNFLLEIQAEIMTGSVEYSEHPVGLSVSFYYYTRHQDLALQKLEGVPDLAGGTQCLQNSFINIEM